MVSSCTGAKTQQDRVHDDASPHVCLYNYLKKKIWRTRRNVYGEAAYGGAGYGCRRSFRVGRERNGSVWGMEVRRRLRPRCELKEKTRVRDTV